MIFIKANVEDLTRFNRLLELIWAHYDEFCTLAEKIDDMVDEEGPKLISVEKQWFPVGVKLTSMENGQLIIAGPDTPEEMIVGRVTLNGLEI